MSRRIIVCGSRRWIDREIIADRLQRLADADRFSAPVIVHGSARGADSIADEEARKAGFGTEPHPARWDVHGKRAGLIRNEEMASLGADLCIAFWDGASVGTLHMVTMARRRGIPVEIVASP